MRFHNTMTTLESQKYIIARTVRTENISVVGGRLVIRQMVPENYQNFRWFFKERFLRPKSLFRPDIFPKKPRRVTKSFAHFEP